jgi:NAD(P)H-dependent flavin oxidoreductase YrpB (nitropropane dioxygenase family)
MGTRFVAVQEAPVHPNVKQQIVRNTERDTVVVFRKFRNTARVARNRVSEEIAAIEAREGTTFEDVAALASGARGRSRVLGGGDMDDGLWWASQAQGLISDVPTCQEVVDRIIGEAERLISDRLPKLHRAAPRPEDHG